MELNADIYRCLQSPWHWLLGCKFRQDTRTKASVGSQDSRVRVIALTLTGNLQDHRCLAPSSRDLIDWYSPHPGNKSPCPRGLECRVIGSDPERTPECLRSTPRVTTDKGLESSPPAPQCWTSKGECRLRRGRKPRLLLLPNLEKNMRISYVYLIFNIYICIICIHYICIYILR